MDDAPRRGRLLSSSIVSHSATSICDQRNLFHSPCDPPLTDSVLRSLSTERTPTSRELDALCVERPVGPQATGSARPRHLSKPRPRNGSTPFSRGGGETVVGLATCQRGCAPGSSRSTTVPRYVGLPVQSRSPPLVLPGGQGCKSAREALRSSVCSRGGIGVCRVGAQAPPRLPVPCRSGRRISYLADPASSHMLVSKIKPCMSKYRPKQGETANGSLNQLWFIGSYPFLLG